MRSLFSDLETRIVFSNYAGAAKTEKGDLEKAKAVYQTLCPPHNRYPFLAQQLFASGIEFNKPVKEISERLRAEMESLLMLALRKNARLLDEYVLVRSHYDELGLTVKEFSQNYCNALKCDVRSLREARLAEDLELESGDLSTTGDDSIFKQFNEQDVSIFGLSMRLYDSAAINAHLVFCESRFRLFCGMEIGALILAPVDYETRDNIKILGKEMWTSPSISPLTTSMGSGLKNLWLVRSEVVNHVNQLKWKPALEKMESGAGCESDLQQHVLQKAVKILGSGQESDVLGFLGKELIKLNCAFLRGCKFSAERMPDPELKQAATLLALMAVFPKSSDAVRSAVGFLTQSNPMWRCLMRKGLREFRCFFYVSNKNGQEMKSLQQYVFMMFPLVFSMDLKEGTMDAAKLIAVIDTVQVCLKESLLDLHRQVEHYMASLNRDFAGRPYSEIMEELAKLAQVNLEEPVIKMLERFPLETFKRISIKLNNSKYNSLEEWCRDLIECGE